MKCVVCGVGNRLRGDDAVGPIVVDKLSIKFDSVDGLLFLDCGSAPENFLSRIDDFSPDKVILVDAVDLKKDFGAVEIVDTSKITGYLHSTHQLPLSLFLEYLQKDKGRDVIFIGVQPKDVGFGCELSEECGAAVDDVLDFVSKLIV